MARPRVPVGKYCIDTSNGQAYCRVLQQRLFLGAAGSAESWRRFYAAAAEATDVAARRATRFKVKSAATLRIYCFSDGDGYLKIGISENVKANLRTIQRGHPRYLTLVFAFPGDFALEAEIKLRLGPYRTRMEGEWFFDLPAVREVLASYPGQENPADVLPETPADARKREFAEYRRRKFRPTPPPHLTPTHFRLPRRQVPVASK
jgi:hypothetical protein